MNSVTIRFYGELNDFLPDSQRQITFTHLVNSQTSVKDLIESIGVPHPEVDLILINGHSSDFSRLVKGGERVAVYPRCRSLDVSGVTRVRPEPLTHLGFVLDIHLGKLAIYLRLLGFDTRYANDAADDWLAAVAAREGRILLTCDRNLLKRNLVSHGYCLRSRDPVQQVAEVLNHFDLYHRLQPFRRCLRCNETLEKVSKEAVFSRLPEKVRENHEEFYRCPGCDRLYWKGTHYTHMHRFLRNLLDTPLEEPESD